MAAETKIVPDANILIRAVLGKKVRNTIEKYANSTQFFTPDVCFADARKYLPALFAKRNLPADEAIAVLSEFSVIYSRFRCLPRSRPRYNSLEQNIRSS